MFFTVLNDVVTVTVPTITDFDYNYSNNFTSYSDKGLNNNNSIDINTQLVSGPSKIYLDSNEFTSYNNSDMNNIQWNVILNQYLDHLK